MTPATVATLRGDYLLVMKACVEAGLITKLDL